MDLRDKNERNEKVKIARIFQVRKQKREKTQKILNEVGLKLEQLSPTIPRQRRRSKSQNDLESFSKDLIRLKQFDEDSGGNDTASSVMDVKGMMKNAKIYLKQIALTEE